MIKTYYFNNFIQDYKVKNYIIYIVCLTKLYRYYKHFVAYNY